MALTWRPSAQRFAFVSDDVSVVTSCKYDSYMWHHVVVSIDEAGKGQILVDGKAQSLLNDDLTSHSGGDFFQTAMYPNKCPSSADDDCCTLRMATKCDAPAKYRDFDGIMDEVGVWSRALSPAEVVDAMFRAPAYLPSVEVSAPTSNQTDSGAGRVLWGRFNGGCSNTAADGPINIEGLGSSARYAYGGVPWLAPSVTEAPAEIPLDGAQLVSLKGVGFSRSPFTHCVLVHPDPMGHLATDGEVGTILVGSTSGNGRGGSEIVPASAVTYSGAYVATGDAEDASTRGGQVPTFQAHATTQLVGFFDEVMCEVPVASGMAEGYRLAVSNDGGMTAGATKDTTAMEFSVEFDGTVTLTGSGVPSSSSRFTVSVWVYPKKNVISSTIVELGTPSSPFGLYFENGLLVVRDSPLGGQGVSYSPMSLNTWHYLQLSVGQVGVSGNQLTARLDGMAFHGPTNFRSTSPGIGAIGTGYHGYIDELRLYDDHVDDFSRAFERELDQGALASYYRFNGNLKQSKVGGNSASDLTAEGQTFSYASHFAPWEPTVVYSVNGRALGAETGILAAADLGDSLEVSGFNFAESEYLKCMVGSATMVAGVVLDQYNKSSYQCTVPGAGEGVVVGERAESRPDGRELTKEFYPSFTMAGSASTYEPVSKNGSTVVCSIAFDPNEYTVSSFAVANGSPLVSGPSLSKLDLYGSGNSLKCQGALDFHRIFKDAEELSTYAVSFWTYVPESSPASADQIVISFEGDGGHTYASVVFDGNSFSYYDDNILSTGSAQAPALEREMWHFVVLSVDEEGEGRLYVDCDLTTTFTTASRPPKSTQFHVCGSTVRPGDFPYSGLVDEITIFKDFSDTQTQCPTAFTDKTNALAHFSMNIYSDPAAFLNLILDETQNGFIVGRSTHVDTMLMQNLTLVKSSAPWEEPLNVEETFEGQGAGTHSSILNGNRTTVKVSGINLAPSPFFRVRSKDATLPSLRTVKGSQSLDTVSISLSGDCHADSSLEIMNNYQTSSGVTRTYGSSVGVANLFDGLLVYYPLDGTEEDRDLMLNSATRLPVTISVPPKAKTLCVWVIFEDYIDASIQSEGWKFLCIVEDGDSTLTYLNGYLATGAVAASYEGILTLFKQTGQAFGGQSGVVDDVWIYDRSLSACEVEARYYTSDYAIESGNDPVSPSTDSLRTTNKITLEAWIRPYDIDGMFHIASSHNENEVFFSMVDGSLALSIGSKGCGCTSCEDKHEHISEKAKVPANKWSHAAVSYSGTSMSFYVDGVLRETKTLLGAGKSIESGGMELLVNKPVLTSGFKNFSGLLHSFAVFNSERSPDQVRSGASCPLRDTAPTPGFSHVSFNEDNSAGFYDKLVNMSYSDPVDSEAMTLNLKAAVPSGAVIPFAAVARSSCGKKAVTWGMELGAVLTKDSFQKTISISDTGDGNYHGLINTTGLACGDYKLTVAPSNLVDIPLSIVPGLALASSSELVSPQTEVCFGVPRTVSLVAKDANGCPVVSGADSFKIHVTGPHSETIDLQYSGSDGVYSGTFTPKVAGAYSMSGELLSGPEPGIIGQESEVTNTKYVCFDVCQGHSKEFSGSDSIVLSETGPFDLDIAYEEISIDFWVNAGLSPGNEAFLLTKTSTESGTAKGYTVTLDPTYNTLSVCIYTSLGEYRTAAAPALGLEGKGWYHVAITYTGTELSLYGNGVKVGTSTFQTKRGVHANPYAHPLEIGQGFKGHIDEIKFWKVALSAEQIKESSVCPPYNRESDLDAYIHFNEAQGTAPTSPWPRFEATPVKVSLSTPQAHIAATTGDGPGALSLKYSSVTFLANTYELGMGTRLFNGTGDVVSKAGATTFKIEARDECGFHFTKSQDGAFQATATPLTKKVSDESISAVDVTEEFPIFVQGVPKDIPLTSSAFVCSGGKPDAYPSVSHEYYGSVNVDQAGKVKVAVAGLSEDIVEVVPGAPKSISIEKKYDMESGQLGSIDFIILDSVANVVLAKHGIEVSFVVGMTQYNNIPTRLFFEDGHYKLYFTPPVAGVYAVTIKMESQPEVLSYELVTVQPGGAKAVIAAGHVDPKAGLNSFEHAALVRGNSLITFGGGIKRGQAYTNEIWELENYDPVSSLASNGLYGYMKRFEVTSQPDFETFVGIVLNTQDAIATGRMTRSCSDLHFASAHDHMVKLEHFILPSPGCGASDTLIYVRVPGSLLGNGSIVVDMFHGGVGFGAVGAVDGQFVLGTSVNTIFSLGSSKYLYSAASASSSAVIGSENFDPFEGTTLSPEDMKYTTDPPQGTSGNTSGVFSELTYTPDTGTRAEDMRYTNVLPSDLAGTPLNVVRYDFEEGFASLSTECSGTGAHERSTENAFQGEASLKVSGSGHSIKLNIGEKPLQYKFKLQAHLYDSGLPCSASHFMSLNDVHRRAGCGAPQSGDSVPLIAYGVHTACHASRYCVYNDSSWVSTPVRRHPHWVLLEAESDGTTLTLSIDGVQVLNRQAIELSAAYLAAGAIFDQAATAFWDEISVLELPAEAPTVVDLHDGPALFAELSNWKRVPVASGSRPPPARLGHTAALVSPSRMAVFGGERNAHLFGDLQVFDFSTSEWTVVRPSEPSGHARPRARYDHVAFVHAGEMYIHGGLAAGGEILGDLWAFDFGKNEWREVAPGGPALLGRRFGHTVAERDGTFYVFGGYSDAGPTSDFYSLQVANGTATPVVQKLDSGAVEPRFAHSSFAEGDSVHVVGGNDDDNNQKGGLWSYNVLSGQWSSTQIQDSVVCEASAFPATGGIVVSGGSCGEALVPGELGTPLLHLPKM